MFKHFIKTIVAASIAFFLVSLTAALVYDLFLGQKGNAAQGDGTILLGIIETTYFPIIQVLLILLLITADYFSLKYLYKIFTASGRGA